MVMSLLRNVDNEEDRKNTWFNRGIKQTRIKTCLNYAWEIDNESSNFKQFYYRRSKNKLSKNCSMILIIFPY